MVNTIMEQEHMEYIKSIMADGGLLEKKRTI